MNQQIKNIKTYFERRRIEFGLYDVSSNFKINMKSVNCQPVKGAIDMFF